MPIDPSETLENTSTDLSQAPGAERRDSIIQSLATGELAEPTREQNDEASRGDKDDYQQTNVLSDEDLVPSKILSWDESDDGDEEVKAEGREGESVDQAESSSDSDRRAAAARLAEIGRLREKSRKQDERQAATERALAELQAERIQQTAESELPPELADSPAFQYFEKKRLEDRAEQQRRDQVEFDRNNASRQINDVTVKGRESALAYTRHTPDWNEAYQFARAAVYTDARARGASEDQIRLDEAARIAAILNDGGDPAHEIYEFALQAGYKRGTAPNSPEPGGNGSQPVAVSQTARHDAPVSTQQAKVRRIRRGVQDSAASSVAGGSDRSHRGAVNLVEVNQLLTKDQMVSLFQHNPDAFDTLAQPGGRISRSLLEGL